MISNEIKSRVAQNCSLYNSRAYCSGKSLINLNPSCDNCDNFVRGHCVKNIFDDICEKIRLN